MSNKSDHILDKRAIELFVEFLLGKIFIVAEPNKLVVNKVKGINMMKNEVKMDFEFWIYFLKMFKMESPSKPKVMI